MKQLFILCSCIFCLSTIAQQGALTVNVKNIASNEGTILIALYDSEANFLNKRFKGSVLKIDAHTATVTWADIPEGIYAVSLFHDENENNKMDTNFMGIPKEDYGTSNDAKGFMGPPSWEDAKFKILSGEQEITITL